MHQDLTLKCVTYHFTTELSGVCDVLNVLGENSIMSDEFDFEMFSVFKKNNNAKQAHRVASVIGIFSEIYKLLADEHVKNTVNGVFDF